MRACMRTLKQSLPESYRTGILAKRVHATLFSRRYLAVRDGGNFVFGVRVASLWYQVLDAAAADLCIYSLCMYQVWAMTVYQVPGIREQLIVVYSSTSTVYQGLLQLYTWY